MKNFRIALALCIAFVAINSGFAQMPFLYDGSLIDDAKKVSQLEGKPMLLYFTADWCAPCQVMKENVFSDKTLAYQMNENFITVSIDRDIHFASDVVVENKIERIPTFILLSPEGAVISRMESAVSGTKFYQFIGLQKMSDLSLADVDLDKYERKYATIQDSKARTSASDFQSGRVEVNAMTYEELKAKSVNKIGQASTLTNDEIQDGIASYENDSKKLNSRIEAVDFENSTFQSGRIEPSNLEYKKIQAQKLTDPARSTANKDNVSQTPSITKVSNSEEVIITKTRNNSVEAQGMDDEIKAVEGSTKEDNLQESKEFIVEPYDSLTYIQAGAFNSIDNADELMEKLHRDTDAVSMSVESDENNATAKYYKVLLGPIYNQNDKELYTQLLAKHNIIGFEVIK